jgi:hypothetical protein
MMLAAVSLTQPATGRFANVLGQLIPSLGLRIPGTAWPLWVLIGIAMSIGLVVAVAVHDWLTLRRVHPATLWGGAPYLVLEALFFTPFYGSAAATAITHWIAGLPV